MTKRTYAKPKDKNSMRKTRKRARKRRPIPICVDNEELLQWKRVDGKGLYELYRENTGGPYFVRFSSERCVVEYPMDPIKAEFVIRRAKRKRIEQIPNASLRNGYAASFEGEWYDTILDEVVFVGTGSETDAAAIYRNRAGQFYVHHIENGVDEILKVYDDVDRMRTAIDVLFNQKPSFIDCLNWVDA
jgi:hypothetical protein